MHRPRIIKYLRGFFIGFLLGMQLLPNSFLFAENLPDTKTSDSEISVSEISVPVSNDNSNDNSNLKDPNSIRYQKKLWNEMRRRLESGEDFTPAETIAATAAKEAAQKSKAAQTPPIAGPGINVVLPYESGLSISGRKAVDFNLTSTIYQNQDSSKGRVNKTDFTLDQQLQVRVKGTVGRKVTVNVDFDDTRDNKRDINVEYKGDPDEILQSAAFGDISIALPSTEFVAYSKSVFGARAELQFLPKTGFARYFPYSTWHRHTPEKVKMYMIGSRTKGITQTKRFTGQTLPQRVELNDIAYQRRKFYMLAFSTGTKGEDRSIVPGSEQIFLDDQDPNNNNIDETTRTFKVPETLLGIGGITASTATFSGPFGENTGVFKKLVPGIDYSVDYIKGVIQFKRVLTQKSIIVADYVPFGNTQAITQLRGENDPLTISNPIDVLRGKKPFLLKPDESLYFGSREVKTYYDLGNQRIVHDDGKGNFTLKVIDLNRNDPQSISGLDNVGQVQTKPVPQYPQDVDVDFENGFFNFIVSDNFHSPNNAFTDDIYLFRDDVPAFKNRYRVFVEYRFRKGNFTLDQTNLVPQSEQVYLDSRKMTRDVDYFIDYDIGLVTFFRPDQIKETSVIEITYDYSPFGGQGEETLAGLRSEIYFTNNFFMGNSILLNFSTKQRGLPDVRSTSKSIMVMESDLNWKGIKLKKIPLEIKGVSAEIAQSVKNPNTSDKALLESFEGIQLADNANLIRDYWQVAAVPEKGNANNAGGSFNKGFADVITLSNQDISVKDITQSNAVDSTDKIQTLNLGYRFHTVGQNEAASIVQVLNPAGLDFFSSKRQFLQLWINGDNSNNKMMFRLGGVNELSDSGNSLRTEDKNNTGTLSPGEDIGWNYINPDGSVTVIGPGNGRMDTQDLNNNGRIDGDDQLGNYASEIGTDANPLIDTDGNQHKNVDWTGWKLFQVPLNIKSTDQTLWASVKNMRVTLVNTTGIQSGTIILGKASVVGTRFQDALIDPTTAPISIQTYAANNQDNPEYPSLTSDGRYKDLYDLQDNNTKRREQALAIRYQRTALTTVISTVTVQENFSREFDISTHKRLKFYINGDAAQGETSFFIRIGNGSNYLESKFKLNSIGGGWQVLNLDIEDKNRDGLLDHNDSSPIKWTRTIGSPSLKNISQLTFGLEVPAGGPDAQRNVVYVNEIYLEESSKNKGVAYRFQGDFAWTNWGAWGGSWRSIDRNFETLTSVGSGTDSKTGSGYLNFSRLAFLPLNTSLSYTETVTPQIQTVNDPNTLVSVLNEGKNITQSQNLSGGFLMTRLPWIPKYIRNDLPNLDFSGDHSIISRSAGDRFDETYSYRYGSSYTLPWQPDILPTGYLMFKPLPTSISFSANKSSNRTIIKANNTDTDSITTGYNLSMGFQFFNQMGMNTSYNYSKAYDDRNAIDVSSAVAGSNSVAENNLYFLGTLNKSMSQSLSTSGSLRIFPWLAPSFSYSITTNEAYNVTISSFGETGAFGPGKLKSITRSSNADVNLAFSPKEVFKLIPYVRVITPAIESLSLSGGYSLADGDSYENVDADFFSRNKLFIRNNSLDVSDPKNPNARRNSLTASDTQRLSGRWSPFDGYAKTLSSRYWAPVRNLSLSGTFTETKTDNDSTGTKSSSISRVWPDFVFSTSELEHVLFLRRWMSDTRLSGSYQERLSEVIGQTRSTGLTLTSDFTFTLFHLLQFTVGYNNISAQEENLQTNQVTSRSTTKGLNTQVITTLTFGNWRVTPSYNQSQSETEDGTGKKTSDVTTRSAGLQFFGDISVPRFFRLPLGKQLSLKNRLILSGGGHYNSTRNDVDDTQSVDIIDFSASGDLEVTPNIRIGFGGGYSRTLFKARKEEDFSTLNLNSKITIQF